MNLFDLKDEVAVVIGGSGVLGGAVAEALAGAGASVAVIGRNADKGTARADAINARFPGRATFFAADAMSAESLRAVEGEITATLGSPTFLFNGAGGNNPRATVTAELALEAITASDWAEVFDANLVGGTLLPCQVFGPGMCARGVGSIINVASVSGHIPLSRVVAYSAAKAAVINLTQFLSREWAPHGVRVNSITPGFFPAEQNRRLLFNEDGTPTPRAASILAHTPMARFGTADELGGAAVFLAAKKASGFVTGIDLRVDGGFLSTTL